VNLTLLDLKMHYDAAVDCWREPRHSGVPGRLECQRIAGLQTPSLRYMPVQ